METKKAKDAPGVDYSELIDFLADKFDKNKEEIINEIRVEMRTEIKEALKTKADKADIENLKSSINAILTRITVIGNNVDDYRSGQISIERKVKEHDKWITKAAPKIGIKVEDQVNLR